MSKKLLIVESPAKAKTIAKYLGDAFTVKSSVGHIRDLPKKGLSIKIVPEAGKTDAWTFTPSYEISPDKKKVVEDLRKAATTSDEVFLAPDPDREGEAIAWHLGEVLADVTKGKPVHRVTYNEITKNAVCSAVANPGTLNMARVDAQQARRILDRLVGFKVSPLLWRNLQYGYSLSAGRVQSVALRLLVEREREIAAFKPVAYWVLGVEAAKGPKETAFVAKLARLDGEKPDVKDQGQAATYVDDLDGSSLRVVSVKMQPKTRHPYPPFTTSTLQQAASSVCGFSPHRTMVIAQKLYEAGLITYMRTDSVNIAAVAREAARKQIEQDFGAAFVPAKPNVYRSKAGAQEAHEAIRPTDVAKRPGALDLDPSAAKLYDLIWRRFLASQMADARLVQKTVGIEAEKDALRHSYLFTASTTAVEFEGFLAVMKTAAAKKDKAKDKDAADDESDEVKVLPPLAEGQTFDNPAAEISERYTQPPKAFTEDTLLSAMESAGKEDTPEDAERKGLGTTATRAGIIEKLISAGFAERKGKKLIPTKDGYNLVAILPDSLTSPQLTAEWETRLTGIAKGSDSPADFMRGIEEMTAGLVKTYSAISEDKAKLFTPQREAIGTCPRCGAAVYEGKKNFYCSDRACSFVMWKNDRFFEQRKKAFTKAIAAALLKDGKVKIKGMYSTKTGKTFDGVVLLADTGGKYVNFRVEQNRK